MAKESTQDLLKYVMEHGKIPSSDNLIPEFNEYLESLFQKYHVNANWVHTYSNISRSQVYSFLKPTKGEIPTRDQIINMMVAIGATYTETLNALKYALQKELYVRVPRDCMLISCFMDNEKLYAIENVVDRINRFNKMLLDAGERPVCM